MNVKVLDWDKALLPGAETWVIPPLFLSQWAQKINWLLNFQLSKAEKHVAQDVAAPLKEILDQEELIAYRLPYSKIERQSLLIINPNLVPNKFTVQVFEVNNPAGQLDLNLWLNTSLKICQNLNTSSVRFFTPKNLSPEKFKTAFAKLDTKLELEVVYESELIQ